MFILSLALLGQSAQIDADIGKAARRCAAAFTVDAKRRGVNPLRTASQIGYLGLAAARAEGAGNDVLLASASKVLNQASSLIPAATRNSSAIAIACDKRFPLARATAPAPLPSDPADRDILCFAAITLQAGAAAQLPNPATLKSIEPLMARFSDRFDAAIDSKGLPVGALLDAIRSLPDRGNAETIYLSCKQLPA
ncbi:hypothetical protein HZY97_03505 [Sphingomonas sp. R-74633]|uniref:hypothetical protein n=1 Tax=Sphingomonas sp. R-74633 TaxID=2751188 RepID=UPI0015D27A4A|nr:hypothetical protein [Sphingomonas sp. R-74633]NYT39810.1 hypothetical protein [Sphingomonas sp. R-74633]